MKKDDFINKVHKEVDENILKKHTTEVINAVFDVIKKVVTEKEDLVIVNFGKFYMMTSKGTIKTNPATKKRMKVPPRKTIRLQLSRKFYKKLNNLN